MQELKINGIEFVTGHWPLNQDIDTIVFIHGSGGTHVLWHAQVDVLADRMNTIAVNLPGHGGSDGPGKDRIEDYAKSVSNFIESLGVQKPVICGLSIGGAIVLQLLMDESEKYKAGIVVNSGARLKVMPLIFEMIETDYLKFVNSMYSFGASPKTDPAKVKPVADSMAACSPEVTRKDFTACNTFDAMGHLDKITTPLLVMTASEDQLTPVKYGQFLADRVSHATLATIADAGHLSPIEKPDDVSRAILAFINSLPAVGTN